MAAGNYLFSGTTPAAPGTALLPVSGSGDRSAGTNVAIAMDQFESMSVLATLVGATGGAYDVYLQTSHDNGASWEDLAHWPQVAAGALSTTTVWKTSRWNQSGAASTATGDAALAANTFLAGEWGDRLRVKVVAGALTVAGAAITIKIIANRVYSKN